MTTHFDILETSITDLWVVQCNPIVDSRGYFERIFCSDELQSIIPYKHILQINHSLTLKRGTVRGLHFQYPPYAEIKLVSCLNGEIFDVAVDLRQHSPTFLKWHAERLKSDDHKIIVIPEGFAHGFQALVDHCEIIYFVTAPYAPKFEAGLNAQDPTLGISWPLPIFDQSARDVSWPLLDESFSGLMI